MADNSRLEGLKALHLRAICKDLSIRTHGCKLELLSRVRAFLDTEEGRLKAYLRLSKSNLTALFNDPDPFLTLGLLYRPPQPATSMIEPPSEVLQMESRYKNEIRCICIQGSLPGIPCTACKRIQHIRCVAGCVHMNPYLCPLCQLLRLDLCTVPALPPLVQPYAVSRSNPNITRKHMDRLIRISASTQSDLSSHPGQTRIELRCLRLDGRGSINTWPTKVRVKINGEEVLCMPDTVYYKVQRGPLDVTSSLKLGDNVMEFLRYDDPEYYVVGVFLVRVTSPQLIAEQLLSSSRKLSYAEGLAFVLSTISSDDDLRQDATPVSVKCPISLRYIHTAVRGTACTHVQCYDLETFIIIFGKNAQCPECGKIVTAFLVDDFVTQLALQAQEKAAFTVYVHRDGTLTFLTADHDQPQEAIDAEEVGESVGFVRGKKEEETVDLEGRVEVDVDKYESVIELD